MKGFSVFVIFSLIFLIGVELVTKTTEAIGTASGHLMAGSVTQPASGLASLIVDRDDDPPDGAFPCSDAPNDCSLRGAIAIANRDSASTLITFADHYRIILSRPLPSLTENGTVIQAHSGQEVHINGNGVAGRLFEIVNADSAIEGLRLYGAGAGEAHIVVGQAAQRVVVANNVIGDDDAPAGGCDQGDMSYGGIYVDGGMEIETAVRVWIYGNIIECLAGVPGNGITIATDKVVVGRDKLGNEGARERNVIRGNQGYGIDLGAAFGNTICNNHIYDNLTGGLAVANYNNDIMKNDIQ